MAMRRASMDSPRTAVEDFQLPSIVRVYSLQDEGTQNLEDRLVKDKSTENPSLPNGGVLQEDTSSHNSTETGAMIGTLSAEVSQSHIAGRIWYPPSPGQVNPRGPEVLNHQSMPQVSMNHAPVVENGSYVQSSNQLSCIIVSPTGNAPTSMHNVPLAINSPPPTPPQQIHIPVPSHLSGIQFLPAAPCVENNNQNPRLCGRDHSGGNVTDTSSHPPVEVNKVPLLMKLLETDLLMTSRSYPQPQWRNILPTVNTSLNTDSQQVVSSADAHFQAQNCNQAGINKGTTDRSNSDSPPVCTIYPSGSGIMAPNPQLQLFHK
ncbi:uncharacterized protein [Diadema setosum]|uniref:uncharacterized protein n=1 Tax=Diadema setosum TaxID=31175 RepID=UPI003B3B13A0